MRKLVMGLALASTALATPALARDGQWYIGVDGGAMIVEDTDVNGGDAKVEHDTGYDFGGVIGHDFGAFRLESEVSYREAQLDKISIGSDAFLANGKGNALSFMLNGLFDFGPDDGLQGFIGGGIGVARVDLTNTITETVPGLYDDSDTGLAWQLLAGLRAPLSGNWDVGVKYRYFNAPNVNIVANDGSGLEGDFKSHSLMGSLIYNFGAEAPPPPPPPPRTGAS